MRSHAYETPAGQGEVIAAKIAKSVAGSIENEKDKIAQKIVEKLFDVETKKRPNLNFHFILSLGINFILCPAHNRPQQTLPFRPTERAEMI